MRVSPFHERFVIGCIHTGYALRAVVTVEAKWEGTRLRMTAEAKRPGTLDIDQGGQMDGTLRELAAAEAIEYSGGWDAARLARLLDLWDRWHLNDSRPGCEHQQAEGWELRPIDPGKPLDAYGLHYEGQRQPSWNMLTWIRPDEHPDGLLTKPCPTCGYPYGSEWRTEEVPAEALRAIKCGGAIPPGLENASGRAPLPDPKPHEGAA